MIYIDMDGVVADFDASLVRIFGVPYDDLPSHTVFWKSECVSKAAFRRAPAIPAGIEMVRQIQDAGFRVCFMTSTGGLPHHIDIAKQKLDWLQAHDLGDCPVAFCMDTNGKGRYAQPGRVLIDDREKVCDAWRHYGGTAIRFERALARDIALAACALEEELERVKSVPHREGCNA